MPTSQGLDRWTNSAQTTINMGGNMNNSQTNMTVTSALAFPLTSLSYFRVLVDSEIMQVIAGQGTTGWTVIRGVEGTAPAAHNNGATVTHDISAFELNSFRQEFNVVAYGAAGDNTADDSTAFQNAINDAHAQAVGGVVFLPTLAYKILSSLTTYANVVFLTYGATLSGAGAASVTPIIKWTLLGGLVIPGSISGVGGLTVSGGLTISSGGLNLSGGGTITGNLVIAPAQASGQIGLTLSPSAVAAVTAETVGEQHSAQTLTITGGYTTQRFRVIKQGTISAGSVLTVTNAATLAIEGAPIAAGSAVITNAWALWIQAGTTRFDGPIDVNSTTIWRGTGLASAGTAYDFKPPAVASVVAETFNLQVEANTLTITAGFATERFNVLQAPTISAASSLTVTSAATLAIAGPPAASGFATITNPYSLWIQAGVTKLDGALNLAASASNTVPTIPSANGAKVWIQSSDPGGSSANGDLWVQG